jgi:hypothetical protein
MDIIQNQVQFKCYFNSHVTVLEAEEVAVVAMKAFSTALKLKQIKRLLKTMVN